ncbi:MAG: DMT family transporter [bacterium]|nr:DMT family transporter [bacterium]
MRSFLNITPAWKGAFWKIWACFCFAIVNGLVRLMTGGAELEGAPAPLPFAQIAFLQNIVGACLLLPWALRQGKASFKTSMPGLHAFRILFAAAGLMLWYGSLRYMPIAYALALSFTGPIITVIACKIFLKEDLTPARLLAIALSIGGAFLITRPDQAPGIIGGENLGWMAALPLLSATCWVGSKIMSRKIAKNGDSPQLMTLYLLVFMAPVSLIPAFFVWEPLNLEQFLWCGGIALAATLAHLSIARAFSLAEVTFLTPFGFARLFLSGLIGYVAFGEFPTSAGMWGGTILIIASLLLLSFDGILRRKKVEDLAPHAA